MSYDLAVWYRFEREIGIDEAVEFYSEICSRPFQSFVPGVEMAAFVDAVVERYRAMRGTDDSPWAADPDVAEDCAIMPIQSALAGEVLPIVRELAKKRGLVFFNPQDSTVHQPASGTSGEFMTLELADGRTFVGPDQTLVEVSVRSLSEVNWFIILERQENHFIQAGFGDQAGAPSGKFVIEYRTGGPGEHWRAFSSSIDELVAAFRAYLRGGMEWTGRFSWHCLDVS